MSKDLPPWGGRAAHATGATSGKHATKLRTTARERIRTDKDVAAFLL
jgi:hypothetical protein